MTTPTDDTYWLRARPQGSVDRTTWAEVAVQVRSRTEDQHPTAPHALTGAP